MKYVQSFLFDFKSLVSVAGLELDVPILDRLYRKISLPWNDKNRNDVELTTRIKGATISVTIKFVSDKFKKYCIEEVSRKQ